MSSSELETFKLKQKLAGLDSYTFRGTSILKVHKDAINNQGVIKIPEGVNYIASDAFNEVSSLENFKRLEIPDTVHSIADNALFDCRYLEEIKFSENIEDLGSQCFEGCASLKEVILPDSITRLGVGCFSNCWSLRYVKLPSNAKCIGDRLFYSCNKLEQVDFRSISRLGEYCFSSCVNLKNLLLDNDNIYLKNFCLLNCQKLDSVVLLCDEIDMNESSLMYSDITVMVAPYGYKFDNCNIKRLIYYNVEDLEKLRGIFSSGKSYSENLNDCIKYLSR